MPFTVGQYLTANDLKSQEDAHTLGYGVVNGLKVVPTDPASMDVQVETGKAYVADTLVEKGAVTDLTVTAADPTNPRKDIVVCNSAGTLSIVAGTAEAALPSDKVGVYTLKPEPSSIPANSIILAEIWVPAGATEITGSEIYDKRVSIADFIGHKGDASAHHAKTGDNEVYGLVQAGLATDRPAAGVAKRWYFATDTLILSRDNGTTWDEMARGETAIRLAQLAEKAHASLTGKDADDHTQYLNTTRHDTTTRHSLGTVVPHDALASLTEKAHGSLTGVTASQHHAKTTLFTDLTDRWTLAQAHRGADGKIMVFKGPATDPVEEDKPAGIPDATVGDRLETSADTEYSGAPSSYTKIKEILINRPGAYRVKFDIKKISGDPKYGRIYKNGVAEGAEQSTSSTSYVTFSEDLSGWSEGDLLQLYVKTAAGDLHAQNLRLYSSNPIVNTVVMD